MKQEPEGLYKNFRKNFTAQISKFMATGESFRLTGKSGSGKSKYLRYLSSSPSVKSKYLKPNNVKAYYCDINLVHNKKASELIKEMCKSLGTKIQGKEGFENFIVKQANKGFITYLILDHSEMLQEFKPNTIRMLRGLRDKYKYKLAYIIAYEKDSELDMERLKYLLEISSVEIEMPPLSPKEAKENIEHFATALNLDISNEEKEKIIDVSEGFPKYIKQLLSHKLAGVEIDKAIINIQNLNSGTASGKDYFLEKAVKNMTKSEFMFFEVLYGQQTKVVQRDVFASLLSPESDGAGVSNEAIDQIVSRLRKKMAALKMPFTLKTQRGIGYYLE